MERESRKRGNDNALPPVPTFERVPINRVRLGNYYCLLPTLAIAEVVEIGSISVYFG